MKTTLEDLKKPWLDSNTPPAFPRPLPGRLSDMVGEYVATGRDICSLSSDHHYQRISHDLIGQFAFPPTVLFA